MLFRSIIFHAQCLDALVVQDRKRCDTYFLLRDGKSDQADADYRSTAVKISVSLLVDSRIRGVGGKALTMTMTP